MLKSFSYRFLTLMICTGLSQVSLAADFDPAACGKALSDAYARLDSKRMQQNMTPANANTQNGQTQTASSGNPIADMMNAIAQNNQKMAELKQKEMEKQRELKNEKFKQLNEISDKIHDFRKGEYKQRQEVKLAETAKKKQEAEIRIKCTQQAEDEYRAEIATNNAKAQQAQLTSNSLSNVKGTSKRMQSQLGLFKRRCLANSKTQEALTMVQDEYDAKIHNFKISEEEMISDITYWEGKIPKLEGHIGEQSREITSMMEEQAAALKQQQQMQLIGMGMSLMTSSMGGQQQAAAAGNFQNIDHTLANWDQIRTMCNEPSSSKHYTAPSDVAPYFTEVNATCRQGEGACVKSNNQPSKTSGPSTAFGS